MIRESDIYRQNADNCLQLTEAAVDEAAYKRFKKMEAAWLAWRRNRTGLTASDHPLTQMPG
jgi:hypothetical protein